MKKKSDPPAPSKALRASAEAFLKLFAGLARAHGRYTVKGTVAPGKKLQGSAQTVREGVTVEDWLAHFTGTVGIGIVPIRDDATCRFGAIDVDKYDVDLKKLEGQVHVLELPLVLCRSKSGGGHLFLFLREDVPAGIVRETLMNWAVLLGHSGVEVFPKQVRLAGANDVGNWINIPYFAAGVMATDRYALFKGKPLDLPGFLKLAKDRAVSLKELQDIHPAEDPKLKGVLAEAPPCLQSLANTGFGEGTRNGGLFNLGVYLRKRYGDQYTEHLDGLNQQFMTPPLGHQEVSQINGHLKKKKYEYTCHEPPIVHVCNRQICLTRKYGISGGDDDPGVTFNQLVKLDTTPPIWIWDVNGARLELSTAELMSQTAFHTKVIDMLNIWPHPIKPKAWTVLIRSHLEHVRVEPAPPEASMDGMLYGHVQQFCSSRSLAKSKEELLLGKPWDDETAKLTWFRIGDVHRYLEQQRIHVKPTETWKILRAKGAQHTFFNIKGVGVNVWGIPTPVRQKEAFTLPDLHDGEM